LRGHGESDATFSSYDDVAAGSDLLALTEHLGGRAVLIGNSMAAGAAAWAAAEEPSAVMSLVLIGPFVRNVPYNRAAMLAFRLALLRPWGPAAWKSYYARLFPGDPPTDLAQHQDRIRSSLRKPGYWRSFVATTRTSHEPVEKRLDQISAPALVVMGDRDPDFPDAVSEARWIADRLGGEAVIVRGSGHYPHAEYPNIVVPAVIAFLRKTIDSA